MTDNQKMLEEAAVDYHEHVDHETGQVQRYGVVNQARLLELRKRMAATGRAVLEPFRDWLVELEGKSDARADQVVALSWTAMWETSNRPWQKLYRTDIAWRQRLVLRGALRLFASWLLTSGDRPLVEQQFGKELLNELNKLPDARPRLRDKREAKDHPQVEPLPEEQIQQLLQQLKSRHYRVGGQYPWAHSCCSAVIKTAAKPAELMWVTMDQVARAYHDLEDGAEATLPIWGSKSRARVIPAALIAEEIETWHHWPAPWQVIADIVAARVTLANRRPARGGAMISQQLRAACTEIGIEHRPKALRHAIRWAGVKRLYKQYGTYLAVQQITGIPVERLRRFAWLDED